MRTLTLTVVSALLLPVCVLAQSTRPAAKIELSKSDSSIAPRAALSRKVPSIKLTAIPLSDAIDYVRDISNANIHVNWRALELLNVTRQTPVSITLSDVPVRRVLKGILEDSGAGDLLTYYVDDGVVEVTTKEIADSQMIPRVYPVDDLVTTIPDFAGPTFNLQNQSNQASGAGGGGGGGQSLFSGNSNTTTTDQTQSKQQQADSLVKLITDTVKPEAWRDNGGAASIRYFNGHLIVTAPRSIHQAISGKPD